MADKEYIERNSLLEEVKQIEGAFASPLIIRKIESAPAEDVVKVKHGAWKLHKDGSGTCNQCGHTQKNVWDFDNWQNYCGHCGANMKEGINK